MDFGGRPFSARQAQWIVVIFFCLSATSPAADWPQYRGANHDGISTDRINKQWTGLITNPVWRVLTENAMSSLAVSGGRVFTQTRRFIDDETEVCIALDAATGEELWATPLELADYPNGGVGTDDGPRTTPAVSGDSVFVVTSYLKLFKLSVLDGSVEWTNDLRALYGSTIIAYQNCASPVIENDLIFLNISLNSNNPATSTLLALRTTDGSAAWGPTQNEPLTHSTPVLATIQGVRQLIFASQKGLVALDPATGNLLWKSGYPFTYSTSLGCSPVVYQDMVFVCGAHAYGMGSMVVQARATNQIWTATRLWSTNNPAAHWMTPIAYQGFLYGQFGIQTFDSVNAQLKCVDMRSGVVRWSTNGFGRGATIVVDDHILTITEKGQLVLSNPNTNTYTEVGRVLAIPNYADFTNKCWNAPAVCDGRIFVRSTAYTACFDFSVPGLRLDPPEWIGADKLRLTVRTVNGSAIDSNRLGAMQVRAADDVSISASNWVKLTNSLQLTNGAARLDNLSATQTTRVFIVTEPR